MRSLLFWSCVFSAIWLLLHYAPAAVWGVEYRGVAGGLGAVYILAYVVWVPISSFARVWIIRVPRDSVSRCFCGIAVTVCFAMAELAMFYRTSFVGIEVPYDMLVAVVGTVVPLLATSTLLTVMAYMGGALPAALYASLTCFVPWLLPWQSGTLWQLAAFTQVLLCALFYIALDADFSEETPAENMRTRASHVKTADKLKHRRTSNALGAAVIVFALALLLFCSGVLPVRPTVIATGSMEPELCIGDVAVVNTLACNALSEGDVIEFTKNGSVVVHRIVEIAEVQGEEVFVTKGDANNGNDSGYVSKSDLIGKVVARVPSLGKVSLWLHSELSP